MSLDAITNFGYATLSAGIDSDDTSITLTTGHGARLPSTAFNAPIWDTSYGSPTLAYHAGAAEIVRVTARSTDTLTVTRAQEGTTARSFNTSGRTYAIGVTLTKATYDQLAPSASPVFTGTITSSGARIATATAMGSTVVDVTKLDNTYSATGDATLTFSATPATDTVFGVIITTDGTARTITFPSSYSEQRGATITSATFPASGTKAIYWRRTVSGYLVFNDPLTQAQAKAALGITVDDVSGTLPYTKGGTGTGTIGTVGQVLVVNATEDGYEFSDLSAGSGDVSAASNFGTDNRVIRSNGTTKGVQSSDVEIDDSGNIGPVSDSIPNHVAFWDGHATAPKAVRFTAPTTVTTEYTVIWPAAPGTSGQILSVASVTGTTLTLQWSTP